MGLWIGRWQSGPVLRGGRGALESLDGQAMAEFVRIDILVVNHGIWHLSPSAWELPRPPGRIRSTSYGPAPGRRVKPSSRRS